MTNVKIVVIGTRELTLFADLYSQIFTPPQDEPYFERRFQGRTNVSMMVAEVDDKPVGIASGYELRPATYFCWFCGVLTDVRRMGVATQLIQAQQAFAKDNGYQMVRFECQNQHRPVLHLAISEGYDLVGIRWDIQTAANFVIFERELR
jgi:GNAT superfamily N-acetyltransferase